MLKKSDKTLFERKSSQRKLCLYKVINEEMLQELKIKKLKTFSVGKATAPYSTITRRRVSITNLLNAGVVTLLTIKKKHSGIALADNRLAEQTFLWSP